MLNEVDKTNLFDINNLKYVCISNIFFDHPLSEEEIINFKETLFKVNSINQIYFKGNIDIRSIEIIKYLLEIVPNINDSFIEKTILNTDVLDKNVLLNMHYEHPTTWNIAYKKDKDSYMISSIDKCRNMESKFKLIIDEINSKDHSLIEKISLAYNQSKLLNYSKNNTNLINIIETKTSDSYGFSLYFKEILDRLNIPSFIGKVLEEGNEEYITLIDVKDDKYEIDGLYLFNPCNDSILKDDCDNEPFRSINYNYFGIRLTDYNDNKYNDKLTNILSCLIHDVDYDIERLSLLMVDNNTKENLCNTFNKDFLSLHKRVQSTKKIEDETKLKIVNSIIDKSYWDYKNININKLIETNYKTRQDNIFNEQEKDIFLL